MIGKFALPSGSGGSATPASTTPTLSVAQAAFGVITTTISNYSSYTNPNFSAEAKVGSTVTVADTAVQHTLSANSDKLSNTFIFKDTNATVGTRTLSVRAQEFGDYTQSNVATATYDVTFLNAAYIRILLQSAAGTNTTSYAGINDIRFYTGPGQTGTAYPTTNLTSNTSETGIAVSAGFSYSASYQPWHAADNNTSSTFWWSLTVGNASLNWWQLQFQPGTYPTPPTIKSMRVIFSNSITSAFRILTSDTGAFAGEQVDQGLFTFVNGTNNYG